MIGCLQWLDAVRMKGGESRPDQGGQPTPVRVRKYGPGTEIAAGGAPAEALGGAEAGTRGGALRRSTPSPPFSAAAAEGTTAYPAPQRIGAMTRVLREHPHRLPPSTLLSGTVDVRILSNTSG